MTEPNKGSTSPADLIPLIDPDLASKFRAGGGKWEVHRGAACTTVVAHLGLRTAVATGASTEMRDLATALERIVDGLLRGQSEGAGR
jgi:hypothetical protein